MTYALPFLLCLLLACVASAQTPTTIAITDVSVIDATGAPPKSDMTVVITGNRITALGRSGEVQIPLGAQVVKAKGKFLIPGLWDMHMHLSYMTDSGHSLLVANGVTGVRDMGGDLDQTRRWHKEVADGARIGPRIIAAGPTVDGPNPDGTMRLTVHTPEEGREAVRSLQKGGADFIKVYHFLSPDSYQAIAEEAKARGMKFAGHVPRAMLPAEASDAGQSSIEHMSSLMEGYFYKLSQKGRGSKEAADEVWKELSDEAITPLFRRMVRNGTWFTPTLVAAHSFTFRVELAAEDDPRRRYIPRSVLEFWDRFYSVPKSVSEEVRTVRQKFYVRHLQLVGLMSREGVGLLAGSDPPLRDIFPGFSLHDELALLVEAGLTPMQALQTATRNPARFLGLLESLGTVEKGKLADLVLLNANPLEDIGNTRKIRAVVVNGRYLDRPALDTLLAQAEARAKNAQ